MSLFEVRILRLRIGFLLNYKSIDTLVINVCIIFVWYNII